MEIKHVFGQTPVRPNVCSNGLDCRTHVRYGRSQEASNEKASDRPGIRRFGAGSRRARGFRAPGARRTDHSVRGPAWGQLVEDRRRSAPRRRPARGGLSGHAAQPPEFSDRDSWTNFAYPRTLTFALPHGASTFLDIAYLVW